MPPAVSSRVDTTELTALTAIRDLLRTAFPELGSENVFLTLYPDAPEPEPSGEHFLSVAPGAGSFDEALFAGGGREQLCQVGEFQVTIYSRVQLDQSARDESILGHATEGLLVLKHRVLSALVGADPALPGGAKFSRELLRPIRAAAPEHDADRGIGWLSLAFALSFDWDLT